MADTVLYQRATVARFRSRCGICQEAITPNADTIVCIEDEWAHVECAESEGFEIVEPDSPGWKKPDWWEDT